MIPRLLSPLRNEHQTAELLGLSVKTLRRWRWIGKGPHFLKCGSAVRYADQDITAYLDAAQRRSTSEA